MSAESMPHDEIARAVEELNRALGGLADFLQPQVDEDNDDDHDGDDEDHDDDDDDDDWLYTYVCRLLFALFLSLH